MAELKTGGKGLTKRIVIGMVAGLLLGVILNLIGNEGFVQEYITGGLFHIGGKIFLASLKLLVVPMVFVSLVCGIISLDDIKKLGRVGGKTFSLYMLTTALAITGALMLALLISPGKGAHFESNADFAASEAPSLVDTIINIFPTNPIQAMAEGNMLQVIVFAILFGIALSYSGEAGKRVGKIFNDLNEIILNLVMILVNFAPYGVFFLLAKVFAEQGFNAIVPLAKYFGVVLFALFFQMFVVYSATLKLFSGLNPITFFKSFKEVPIFAFSTASSNATLPVTMEVVEKKLGIHNKIASFTLPLGATINMDGTAIMQGVATVFVSQVYGIEIGLSGYLMVILTATLASIGTAGVPGVGLILLAMVFRQVNLPVEGIGLIIGVDRLLDMVRTAVNVTGDAVVTTIVAKSENQLDSKVFEVEGAPE